MVTLVPDSSNFSLAAGSQFTVPLYCVFGVIGGLSVSLLNASDKTATFTSTKNVHKFVDILYQQMELCRAFFLFFRSNKIFV
jgi:hypothetical protein